VVFLFFLFVHSVISDGHPYRVIGTKQNTHLKHVRRVRVTLHGIIRVHSGNIQVHSGNVQVHSGNIQVHSGNVQVNSGNIQVHSGNVQVNSGNIQVH
jgi:lipopolysaccharide export system protein LptA